MRLLFEAISSVGGETASIFTRFRGDDPVTELAMVSGNYTTDAVQVDLTMLNTTCYFIRCRTWWPVRCCHHLNWKENIITEICIGKPSQNEFYKVSCKVIWRFKSIGLWAQKKQKKDTKATPKWKLPVPALFFKIYIMEILQNSFCKINRICHSMFKTRTASQITKG